MTTKVYPRSAGGIQRFKTWDAAGNPVQDNTTPFSTSWQNRFDGGSNPNWRRMIALGQNATTPASGVESHWEFPYGKVTCQFKFPFEPNYRRLELSGYIFPGIPFPDDPSDLSPISADTEARQKFLSKYRSMRTAFQGGTFFGELREAVAMLRSPAKALRREIDYYWKSATTRASREKTNKRRNRAIQETWLEYSYGFRPLISDIQDAAKACETVPDVFKKISSTVTHQLTGADSNGSQSASLLIVRFRTVSKGTVSVRYMGAVSSSTMVPTVSEQLGFDPSNFAPTIWNLIPYSFLVDYFTNIGSIIDGASLGRVDLAWGCKTVRQVNSIFVTNWRNDYTDFINAGFEAFGSCSGPSYTTYRKLIARAPVDAIDTGITDFQFRIPGMGSTKWLNIQALANMRVFK